MVNVVAKLQRRYSNVLKTLNTDVVNILDSCVAATLILDLATRF